MLRRVLGRYLTDKINNCFIFYKLPTTCFFPLGMILKENQTIRNISVIQVAASRHSEGKQNKQVYNNMCSHSLAYLDIQKRSTLYLVKEDFTASTNNHLTELVWIQIIYVDTKLNTCAWPDIQPDSPDLCHGHICVMCSWIGVGITHSTLLIKLQREMLHPK